MKNILIASIAGLMISSAYAAPTANAHVNSYSYQGKAIRVRVVSHDRHIPAPSSWTPPERIPSPPVTIVHRDQPTKLGGGYGFSSPGFSNPGFSNPGFSNPGYSNPGYSNPGYSNPGYSNPGYSNPGYGNPGYSNPGYSNPGFSSR